MAFTRSFEIRFDDVDAAGLVYYPNFYRLCHDALEECFREGAPFSYAQMITTEGCGLPTVSLKSDFHAPLRFGDRAHVQLVVKKIGQSSLETSYEIYRASDDTLCFEALITSVFIDLQTQRSTPIPRPLRRFFEGLLAPPGAA